jgi:hypothetical protein
MAINPPVDLVAAEASEPSTGAAWWAAIRDFARRRTLGAVGAAVVLLMLILAVFAGVLAPYDPVAVDFGAAPRTGWAPTPSAATCSRA